ncbi:unnamed protein product [Paramecium sonneborni]|uniref:Uncharacterized protein n=1 Tax=Paramecium sonneborni TaxID=65129 RepID=A0A8S1Q936_9CILI|nr:unnamed protein product [Paramecium sonneborni]
MVNITLMVRRQVDGIQFLRESKLVADLMVRKTNVNQRPGVGQNWMKSFYGNIMRQSIMVNLI